ncbi:tapasin-related protein isoform X2 [Monodelphis domestica]|uniref:tapasin-related protein isoform X2 n=1 Tax=Monodelphis domestica TaxID=13616 RepID=UPI0024E1F048|nr:tapasin-related protein isoform X2 [Monodelphis domestica]
MGAPGLLSLLLLCGLGAPCAEAEEPEGPRREVDLILDCSLAAEEAGRPWGAASSESTLVLKRVPVPDDGTLDGFTDFPGVSAAAEEPPVALEASVDQVHLPRAEVLLHAACQGLAVTCELSRLLHQAAPDSDSAYFIGSIRVAEAQFGASLVMRAPRGAAEGAPLHPRLKLPLSPRGTVLASVEFLVMTPAPSVQASLRSSVALPCLFSLAPGSGPALVEWRRQHRGQGQRVLEWAPGQGQGRAVREGARLEAGDAAEAGDASLTLPGLTVGDEGAYICQISSPTHQAQQILLLSVLEPPRVRLSLAREAGAPGLLCSISGYYPLDVAVSWSRQEPGEPASPASGASFSSHRQSSAGTYSLSSAIPAEPGPRGATYRCHVTHVSLPEPVTLDIWVAPAGAWNLQLFGSCRQGRSTHPILASSLDVVVYVSGEQRRSHLTVL